MFCSFHEKHKIFISYCHSDDQCYKDYIDNCLSMNTINKSLREDEYALDDPDEYIRKLLHDKKIDDSSVVLVLVGPNTRRRKHVDWEIYAGLHTSKDGHAGLVGILLPNFVTASDGRYSYKDIPGRLADNIKSGYADMYTWKMAKLHFDEIIETAYNKRNTAARKIDDSRLRMRRNLTEDE